MKQITYKMHQTLALILMISFLIISCKEKDKNAAQISSEMEKSNLPFFKLSLAQWSLHRAIRDDKTLSPYDFAEKASELGFEGIEYVSQLYSNELKNIGMNALLDSLKAKSELYKIKNVLIMVDDEGNLASTNHTERNQAVENHKKWIDAAKYLGCHAIRVNAHGKGNAKEVANAAIESLTKLSAYAEKKGINVLVENHGGFTSNGKWLAEVISKTGKLNCGTLPDFGNWCQTKDYGSINDENCIETYDIYKGVKELMPFAKAVSAKSYDFDEEGNETKIDFARMLQIVKDAGYTGFIGVEYEGENLTEEEGIIATKNLLLKSAN